MKIVKRSVYTMYTKTEIIAENVSEYWAKMIIKTMNEKGLGEFKLFVADDSYVEATK